MLNILLKWTSSMELINLKSQYYKLEQSLMIFKLKWSFETMLQSNKLYDFGRIFLCYIYNIYLCNNVSHSLI